MLARRAADDGKLLSIPGREAAGIVPKRDIPRVTRPRVIGPRFIGLHRRGKLPVQKLRGGVIGFEEINAGFD
jgi:alcohol dehydrogenase